MAQHCGVWDEQKLMATWGSTTRGQHPERWRSASATQGNALTNDKFLRSLSNLCRCTDFRAPWVTAMFRYGIPMPLIAGLSKSRTSFHVSHTWGYEDKLIPVQGGVWTVREQERLLIRTIAEGTSMGIWEDSRVFITRIEHLKAVSCKGVRCLCGEPQLGE